MATLTRRALCAVPVAALAGCAASPVAAEAEGAAEAELRRVPARYTNGDARGWAVRRDGQERGTLWGTFHVTYSGETVLPRLMRERFGQSRSLTTEIAPTPQNVAAIRRERARALSAADPAALARLDAPTRAALRAAGVTPEEEGRLSLLGLAQRAAQRAAAQQADPAGFVPGGGYVDENLRGFARSIRIPARALEQLDRHPDPVWRDPNGLAAADELRLALRRLDGMMPYYQLARQWYGSGQVARLAAAGTAWRATEADLRRADATWEPLLDARNRAWIAPLEQTLAQPGPHFVAFGAFHLLGEQGVVALLRGRGWEVEAVAA